MSVVQDITITDRIGGGDLPREAILAAAPRAVKAQTKIVSVVPNTSSSIGQNQTVQFNIPARGMMRSHSAFLKFQFNPTSTGEYSFAGSAGSCASLINSIQVQAGGTVLENLLNYHLFHNNIVLAHASSAEGLAVEGICAGAYTTQQFTANTQAQVSSTGATLLANASSQFNTSAIKGSYQFTMPIYAGCFNNNNSQALPLFAMQGGLLVTIQTNPISKAIFGTNFTDYTLSNFELQYVEIQPDQGYINDIMSGLRQGRAITIECDSYLNIQTAGSTSLRQMFSLNMQSLNSVLYGTVRGTDAIGTSKFFVASSGSSEALDISGVRKEIFLDNISIYNSSNQLNIDAVNYRLLQEALCGSVTDKAVTPFIQGQGVVNDTQTFNGSYRNQAYLAGIPTRNWVSDDVSFGGVPVSQLSVSFLDPRCAVSDTYYFYLMHSYLMVIDGNMTVSKLM
jgi:hypothetical protein